MKSRLTWILAAIIAAATIAAYSASFHGPFVFDDLDAIVDNPSIRSWSTALHPATDTSVGGRPVLNLSLAASYALSGSHVWSYHALNLAIHLAAALLLFGFLRRTFDGKDSTLLAGAVALLWAVHPLQTESVAYIVQRAESLAGMFYLATFYAFARYAQERRPGWGALSIAACVFGVLTKEVVATAPVVLLVYDRCFVAGTWREAWARRRSFYLILFGLGWAALACVLLSTGGNRNGSIGFGIGVSPFAYALTQFRAIATYLKLSIWPAPLVFDHGPRWVHRAGDILPYAPIVLLALAAGLWALARHPRWGFWAAWFFLILAPTSSIVPGTTQMIVEHRMYLPLAGVLALLALALSRRSARLAAGLLFAISPLFAALTFARTRVYRSEESLWSDTVRKAPDNGYAHTNLGVAYFRQDRFTEAAAEYRRGLELTPESVEPLTNLGNVEAKLGHPQEALTWYTEALRRKPDYAQGRIDLANLLQEFGRFDDAIQQYAEALRLKPGSAPAELNWGLALQRMGRPADAIPHYAAALRFDPDFAEVQFNWGNAARILGRPDEAMARYQAALALKPDHAGAAMNLGTMLLQSGHLPDAIVQLRAALHAEPNSPDAHNSLGLALARSGDLPEAVAEFETALRLRPDYRAAAANLAAARRALP